MLSIRNTDEHLKNRHKAVMKKLGEENETDLLAHRAFNEKLAAVLSETQVNRIKEEVAGSLTSEMGEDTVPYQQRLGEQLKQAVVDKFLGNSTTRLGAIKSTSKMGAVLTAARKAEEGVRRKAGDDRDEGNARQ